MAAIIICSDFGAQKIKSVTVSTISPPICHEVLGQDAMILVFWMLSQLYILVNNNVSLFVHSCSKYTTLWQDVNVTGLWGGHVRRNMGILCIIFCKSKTVLKTKVYSLKKYWLRFSSLIWHYFETPLICSNINSLFLKIPSVTSGKEWRWWFSNLYWCQKAIYITCNNSMNIQSKPKIL